MSRNIRILGARPNHPGRGQPAYVTLHLVLEYLKGEPVESIEISPYVARKLAEDLLVAARLVEKENK